MPNYYNQISSTQNSDSLLNTVFSILLLVMTGYFIFWGLGYTNHNSVLLFILATIFGVFMAFNIGGNDVANSFGTSVGAGTLTIKQALIVAAIFEISGAIIAGGEVTNTIRSSIVDLSGLVVEPTQFIYIMMSALLAAGLWLLFASRRGLPVSTTHSIIGGIVGSSIVLGFILGGPEAGLTLVNWQKIGQIAFSWILSPILGGLVAYLIFSQIKRHVLNYNDDAQKKLETLKAEKKRHKAQHKQSFELLSKDQQISYTSAMARDASVLLDEENPNIEDLESDYYRELYKLDQRKVEIYATKALQNWVPIFAAIGGMLISGMLLIKGLKNIELEISTFTNYLIMGMVGASLWMATFIIAKSFKGKDLQKSTFMVFSWMQVFTAAGFAFSHGSNDIANAIGPFAAILGILRTGAIEAETAVPTLAMVTFGVALIVGLWFIGKEVIQTVGHNLTKMHPSSGFSAELAASAVVMLASIMGLPVSSTHILIGAVLGVGLVNRNTNWSLMKPIGLAWIITLPSTAILSALAFILLRTLFGS